MHTWVEEDDGFEAGVLVVIDLQLLEGQHQLIEDAHGHTAHLGQLRAVPRHDVVIAWVGGEGEGWRGGLGLTLLLEMCSRGALSRSASS